MNTIVLAVAASVVALGGRAARAQEARADTTAVTTFPHALASGDTAAGPSPRARPHLFTTAELRTAAVFAAGAAATAPFDRRLAVAAQRPWLHRGGALSGAMDAFNFLGDPGTVILTGGGYVVGRLAHNPGLADVGLHAGEAVVASGVITAVLKFAVGRARPYAVQDADAGRFRPGHGGGAYASFPSGHATAAFAVAAATASEFTRPDVAARHPTAARLGPPLLYTAAALVGAARVYRDQHWVSDVIAGAGVGTVVGRAVVRFQHGRPPDGLERWLLPATITPLRGGAAVAYRLPLR